jgi:RNA polymerase sigma-70 factor (ECF subfamily)
METAKIPPPGPPSGLSDQQWLQLRDQLERSVARVCPPWLADRRDDLVQTALMRVMSILKESAWKRELGSSYLMRVAYSALVDEIRRVRRRQEAPLTDEEGGKLEIATPSPGPEQRSLSREINRALRECLALQIRSRRVAITLSLQGYSVPEAARRLEWSVKKTESLVYRAAADLRNCLSKKGLKP